MVFPKTEQKDRRYNEERLSNSQNSPTIFEKHYDKKDVKTP